MFNTETRLFKITENTNIFVILTGFLMLEIPKARHLLSKIPYYYWIVLFSILLYMYTFSIIIPSLKSMINKSLGIRGFISFIVTLFASFVLAKGIILLIIHQSISLLL